MAQDIFRVQGVCRLAAEPELRSTPSGTSVCSLRVAWNNSKKNPNTGEWEDVGNFGNVTVWGAQGENCARWLSKGSRIAIEGRLEHRTWKAQDGTNREAHQVVADRVQFLTTKNDGGGSGGSQTDDASQGGGYADDDIPF